MKGRRKGRRKEEEGNDGFGSRFHRFQSTGLVCMNLKPWTGGGLRQGEHAADKGPLQPVPSHSSHFLSLAEEKEARSFSMCLMPSRLFGPQQDAGFLFLP